MVNRSDRVPAELKIFHITHLRNLARIVQDHCLYSDAKRIEMGFECAVVGISGIKERRLKEIRVACHPGTMVGHYVPFYFCPRSIMLYILHRGNHPELKYKEGQGPILHLQADAYETVRWAQKNGVRWAFSDRNAGTFVAEFFNDVNDLDKVSWDAVRSTDFRDMNVKEGKQAEFLVFESFPWSLVEKIGVLNAAMQTEVIRILSSQTPPVEIRPEWYY